MRFLIQNKPRIKVTENSNLDNDFMDMMQYLNEESVLITGPSDLLILFVLLFLLRFTLNLHLLHDLDTLNTPTC